MAREAKIIIRIKQDVKEKFQTHAENLGMTVSGLGAYVIGLWLLKQEPDRKEVQALQRP